MRYPDRVVNDRARRRFIQHAALAGAAFLLPQPVAAATVAEMAGEVLVNGRQAMRNTVIRAGDAIRTGAAASFSFTLGADAFLLRQMTSIVIEGKADSLFISGLRVVSGAVLGVFGPGMRSIMTSLVTGAIRGTGVYVEVAPEQTYFCTCYGNVGLVATDGAKKDVVTNNHAAHVIVAKPGAAGSIAVAAMRDHNNQELAALEKLAGRTPRLTP
jgi:hypothetical protein